MKTLLHSLHYVQNVEPLQAHDLRTRLLSMYLTIDPDKNKVLVAVAIAPPDDGLTRIQ